MRQASTSLVVLLATAVLAGCGGSVHYRDSNAAVDANPTCASRPDRPGEPVSRDCERIREGVWRQDAPSQPIDFRGGGDD